MQYPAMGIRPVNALMIGRGGRDKIQNSMSKLQLGEAKRAIADRDALKGPLTRYATGNRQAREAALPEIAAIDPQKAIELRAKMAAEAPDQLKTVSQWAKLFENVTDQNTYLEALRAGKTYGLDTSNIPPAYNPAFVDMTRKVGAPAPAEYTLGPGQVRMRGGQEIASGPAPAPTKRQIVTGPDGKPYFADTREPVLPGVKSPREQFLEMIGGDDLTGGVGLPALGGGGGNDALNITGVPAGATVSAGSDSKQPTVKQLFHALPAEVKAGILASKDPMQAFSSYMTRSKGLDIQFGPDGKVTSISQGGRPGAGGMQKPTAAAVEKKILSAGDTMAQLTTMKSQFKPEYQQIATRWDVLKTSWKSKLGMKVDPKDAALLNDYVKYKANAYQLFSLTLKELSGVAVNPTEFERAEQWLPSPGTGIMDGDDPIKMKGKIERFEDFTRKSLMKYAYIQRNGLTIDDVDVNEMPRLMNKRGNELAEEYRGQGIPEQKIKEAVKYRLADEFGLVGY